MGGAVLSVIICLSCIVLFWMRRSFSNLFSNREGTKLGSDANMTSDPSYDFIKQNIKEDIVYHHKLSETNPSYKIIQEYDRLCHNSDSAVQSVCNDATQLNPSSSVDSQSSTVIYEGLDGYIKTDLNDTKGHIVMK